ncbi:hypothetical protein LBMAG48_13130 [Phycisphaerae bacterium]|nr:hypothetical protein LBMAG48_13130 [Phycisphaerae bacterium]
MGRLRELRLVVAVAVAGVCVGRGRVVVVGRVEVGASIGRSLGPSLRRGRLRGLRRKMGRGAGRRGLGKCARFARFLHARR